MKTWLKLILGTWLGLLAVLSVSAQQQPVLTVSVTGVSVLTGDGGVAFVDVLNPGSGYTSPPIVTISGGGGSGATAIATISTISGSVTGFQITNSGTGYTSTPSVVIAPPPPPPVGQFAYQAEAKAYLGAASPTPNESEGDAGDPIAITALAVGTFPADGFTYEFYVNGTSIGVASSHPPASVPATIAWTPPQPGSYFISVTATDGSNQATTLPIRYFARGTVVNSPLTGSIVPEGSSIVLKADATVGKGFIKQIQFYDNGTAIASDTAGITPDTTIPYSLIYTPAAGVVHSITAQALDNTDTLLPMSAPIVINVVPPIAPPPRSVISSPADGTAIAIPSSASSNITIAVDASSTAGLIRKVELYIDGVLFGTKSNYPYTFDWHPTVVGLFHLVALTYDDKENVVASTTSVAPTATPAPTSVRIASPPTVTLVSPPAGAIASSTVPVALVADASDSNTGGSISRVQFLQDGVIIAEVTSPTSGNTYSTSATLVPRLDSEGNARPSIITALAVNNLGLSKVSLGVSISVQDGGGNGGQPDGLPPVVALTGPTEGTQLPVNQPALVTASASDPDGNISSVQFYVNGQSIGLTSAYPYSTTWTPASPGNYQITVKATDNKGNPTTSDAVQVSVVDPSPGAPSVSITNPASGSTLTAGNPVLIQATATDDVAVASVQFFVNGLALGGADTSSPYSLSWTPAAPGSYTISARAKDAVGNQTTSAPAVVIVSSGWSPAVTLTSPASNVSVRAGMPVNLSATASDADGTVSTVQFLANGILVGSANAAPYLASWTPTAAGSYSVIAQATDNFGNVTRSSAVTVTVGGNVSPVVSITAPSLGSSVSVGSATMITAAATDADGLVTGVTFYANGVQLGSDNLPPYSINWTPTSEGQYSLTAVALDSSGATTTSAPIVVVAGVANSGTVDRVASGLFISAGGSGSFTMIELAGASATFIGYIPATQTLTAPTTYFFTDIPVTSDGEFLLTNGSGTPVIAGQFSDSGVSGTFQDGANSVPFSGPNTFAQSATAGRSGYFAGSVAGHASSVVIAIVGLDSRITLYVKDGTLTDSGSGSVNASGAFSVTTRAGNKFMGSINSQSGLVVGTLTHSGQTDDFTGAQASGGSFSDGSLRNISTRAQVGTGDAVLIAGFVVNSSAPKRVLIRAVGPGLVGQGVPAGAVLANPTLTLHRLGPTTQIGFNDNWGTGDIGITTVGSQVGAFTLSSGSLDAAALLQLGRGAYTATVSGVGGTSGIALLELYDADNVQAFSPEKMVNIASRGQIGTGDQILIAGFVVNGSAPKKVLIRGVGPALAGLGVSGSITDPALRLDRLVGGAWTRVRENDNWETGNDASLVRTATSKVGATPPLPAGSKDAALLLLLPPGIYSAQLSGTGGTTGVGMIEVYEVQ